MKSKKKKNSDRSIVREREREREKYLPEGPKQLKAVLFSNVYLECTGGEVVVCLLRLRLVLDSCEKKKIKEEGFVRSAATCDLKSKGVLCNYLHFRGKM